MGYPKLTFGFVLVILAKFCQTTTNPHIVIIGAGASGIAAASKLFQNNFTNITILEAENRIGGRIHSVKLSNGYVDLGAEWCHGKENNVVYELAKDLGVLKPEKENWFEQVYRSNSEEVDPAYSKKMLEIFDECFETTKVEEGVSIAQYCTERLAKEAVEKFTNKTEQELALSTLDFFEQYVLSAEGAFDWSNISAAGDFQTSEGRHQSWNGHGYKTILETLIDKIPDDKKKIFNESVVLDKRVSEISWNDNKATLKCSDGSVFDARHVIFTPSLGVLKKEHEEMFKPQLPVAKQEVIRSLGIDGVMKIVLHFPVKWWPEDTTGFALWWDKNDLQTICTECPSGCTEEGEAWVKDLSIFVPVTGIENVLIGWMVRPLISYVEQLPDEKVIEGSMYLLRKFLGHKHNVTEPDQMLRSKWYTNPNFRGTWSYQTIESRKRETSPEEELSKPLPDEAKLTLLFAGEATNPIHYSTVHGAVESGFREADRIINLYNNNNLK